MEEPVGEKIRKLRKSLKLSQGEFGEPLDVSHAAISRIEANNELSRDLAEKISKHYKIDIELIYGEDAGTKKMTLQTESEKFADEIVKKLESYWLEQNNFLKAELKRKDEQIKVKDEQISNLSAVLVKSPPRTHHHFVLSSRGVLVAARY